VKCEGLMAGGPRGIFFAALAVMLAPIQLGMNYVNKMAMDCRSTGFSNIFSVHHLGQGRSSTRDRAAY